ncbi:hypothetical protein BD410DRAFT_837367 [Rickenella mellea]|uniref:Uncharacterized protein n=1 Tax=Rickenella mellea TaxID=50990 RepID=A0A4Y7QC19_9AGAM|nr:hypothetical protein BD410DRAFT_837367 [Rickenella mellea]
MATNGENSKSVVQSPVLMRSTEQLLRLIEAERTVATQLVRHQMAQLQADFQDFKTKTYKSHEELLARVKDATKVAETARIGYTKAVNDGRLAAEEIARLRNELVNLQNTSLDGSRPSEAEDLFEGQLSGEAMSAKASADPLAYINLLQEGLKSWRYKSQVMEKQRDEAIAAKECATVAYQQEVIILSQSVKDWQEKFERLQEEKDISRQTVLGWQVDSSPRSNIGSEAHLAAKPPHESETNSATQKKARTDADSLPISHTTYAVQPHIFESPLLPENPNSSSSETINNTRNIYPIDIS